MSAYCVFGQGDNDLFSRLSGLKTEGADFYDIDGIQITCRPVDAEFTRKNVVKKYKALSLKERDLLASDSTLQFRNFHGLRSAKNSDGLVYNSSFYFLETPDKKIMGIIYTSVNKVDTVFERNFIKLLMAGAIPQSIYSSYANMDSVNFAGRKITLGKGCGWRAMNNIQCPSHGQMNWSVHKDLEGATAAVDNQYQTIKSEKAIRILTEATVPVIFEGARVSAKKVVYDITGVASALAGMSGGKTLTVYMVAAPVRNNYVSCVMSFWNNDVINASGLPSLLDAIMQLE